MTGEVVKIVRGNDPTRGPRTRKDGTSDRGGYFFIVDEKGDMRFAHARDLVDTTFLALKEGTKVRFEPIDGPDKGKGNGLRAQDVERL